ncbi:hypothetical protein AB0D04_06310 [Streptomyces sp. NPDC048483]
MVAGVSIVPSFFRPSDSSVEETLSAGMEIRCGATFCASPVFRSPP